MRNYGFVAPEEIKEQEYVLGASRSLPKTVLQEDGDWSAYLPTYEPQFNQFFDTFGCTIYGTENCIETLERRITDKEKNYSERFIYILAGVRPPGADPHKIAEVIRSEKLILDEVLPMVETYNDYLRPNPMDPKLMVQAQLWEWDFGHEWVWKKEQTKESRLEKIKEALKYSPLGVSVSAWYEENGVYVDAGEQNNHWCELYGIAPNGYKIFDTYDHSHKILSFDHNIRFCKRYALTPAIPGQGKNPYTSLFKNLLEFIKDIFLIPFK